ncbi:MAG: hypothetical protein A2603_14515 [Bdellovibrionales bacterium RIFOXYD1_FULL_55_31]|nr:MAG: hypothetical protein A2603_14515 [Bdellovibrionales bacterium RIFOXYD1_FULL_55_31]
MAQTDCLGTWAAKHYLIYLHGMDTESPSPQEQQNREMLSRLAQVLNLRIALPRAKNACPTQPNLKCWDWAFTKEAVQAELANAIAEANQCFPDGAAFSFVGFSNGGYLVNAAIQNCIQKGHSFVRKAVHCRINQQLNRQRMDPELLTIFPELLVYPQPSWIVK